MQVYSKELKILFIIQNYRLSHLNYQLSLHKKTLHHN
jgi:hypothetical protein